MKQHVAKGSSTMVHCGMSKHYWKPVMGSFVHCPKINGLIGVTKTKQFGTVCGGCGHFPLKLTDYCACGCATMLEAV